MAHPAGACPVLSGVGKQAGVRWGTSHSMIYGKQRAGRNRMTRSLSIGSFPALPPILLTLLLATAIISVYPCMFNLSRPENACPVARTGSSLLRRRVMRWFFPVGVAGAIITALCCAGVLTPLLVAGLVAVGLSGLTRGLDFVLLPLLGVFLVLALIGWRSWATRSAAQQDGTSLQPKRPSPPLPLLVVAFVLLAGSALLACTSSPGPASSSAGAPAAPVAPQAPTVGPTPLSSGIVPRPTGSGQGNRAPAFTVPTLDGTPFSLSQQIERGRATAVFVMATWCTTCIGPTKQLGEFANAYRDHGLDVLVLDIDPKESAADLVRFRDRFKGGEHLWAIDQGSTVTLQYQIRAMETLILIDKTGRIIYRDTVPRSADGLRKLLEEVII